MTIDRRQLLQALGSLSALALAPQAAPAAAQSTGALGVAAFGALSAALTGYPPSDPATAAKVLRAFATPARRASLAALAKVVTATPAAGLDAALRAANLDTIANELTAAWYSGIVTNGEGKQQLVLYIDACVWTAMTFSKPMGVCGGPTGYWSEPPQ
jgi:Membrane bound FAD containing D-sorbitol dehydrogenase